MSQKTTFRTYLLVIFFTQHYYIQCISLINSNKSRRKSSINERILSYSPLISIDSYINLISLTDYIRDQSSPSIPKFERSKSSYTKTHTDFHISPRKNKSIKSYKESNTGPSEIKIENSLDSPIDYNEIIEPIEIVKEHANLFMKLTDRSIIILLNRIIKTNKSSFENIDCIAQNKEFLSDDEGNIEHKINLSFYSISKNIIESDDRDNYKLFLEVIYALVKRLNSISYSYTSAAYDFEIKKNKIQIKTETELNTNNTFKTYKVEEISNILYTPRIFLDLIGKNKQWVLINQFYSKQNIKTYFEDNIKLILKMNSNLKVYETYNKENKSTIFKANKFYESLKASNNTLQNLIAKVPDKNEYPEESEIKIEEIVNNNNKQKHYSYLDNETQIENKIKVFIKDLFRFLIYYFTRIKREDVANNIDTIIKTIESIKYRLSGHNNIYSELLLNSFEYLEKYSSLIIQNNNVFNYIISKLDTIETKLSKKEQPLNDKVEKEEIIEKKEDNKKGCCAKITKCIRGRKDKNSSDLDNFDDPVNDIENPKTPDYLIDNITKLKEYFKLIKQKYLAGLETLRESRAYHIKLNDLEELINQMKVALNKFRYKDPNDTANSINNLESRSDECVGDDSILKIIFDGDIDQDIEIPFNQTVLSLESDCQVSTHRDDSYRGNMCDISSVDKLKVSSKKKCEYEEEKKEPIKLKKFKI